MNAWTNTAAGLFDMRTKVFDPSNSNLRGDRTNSPDIAVVISDGASNINRERTIPNAEDAKRDGITVLAVGLTNFVNPGELQRIASDGGLGVTYWRSPDFRVTSTIINNIVDRTCDRVVPGLLCFYWLFILIIINNINVILKYVEYVSRI